MTWRKREIMEMAREAGIRGCTCSGEFGCLKAFEALVRADEAEKYKLDVHSCGPTCERYACVAMREAVLAEREACAKVCDDAFSSSHTGRVICNNLATAIRARSNT